MARATTGDLTLQTSVRRAPDSSEARNRPMSSSVACTGTARTTSSAPRTALAALSASSVIADAWSAWTPSAREAENPTTRGTPASRACHASEPPMAPRPITVSDDGRTNQVPLDEVTECMRPPE